MGRIRSSAALRRDVTAATRLGVSVRRLYGWEPQEVTEHEYDDEGRLVRSVTTRESEWDDESRAWVFALISDEEERCRGCGHPRSESMDPTSEGRWSVEPVRCHACTAQLRKARATEYEYPEALSWISERKGKRN